MTPEQLPAYSDLILPTVRAVSALGGSAKAREITGQVLTDLGATDGMLAVMQPTRPDASDLLERVTGAGRTQSSSERWKAPPAGSSC